MFEVGGSAGYPGKTNGWKQGFKITFANNWTISVQFGSFNYCDHHGKEDGDIGPCKNAEIAISYSGNKDFKGTGLLPFTNGKVVRGWVCPEGVLKYMNWAAKLADHPDAAEGVIPEL